MSEVQKEITGSVAVLTLRNEAKLNAFDAHMLARLGCFLEELDRDEAVRTVIVTGAGEKAFCCGADIAAWGHMEPSDFARYWVRDGHRIFDRLARLSKPTICAMNGHAFGGGLELAACCDIRVIAPQATIALPEAKVGIVPGWSGTQRLARLLPEPALKELAIFGRRISAQRACDLGFAAEVAEDVLAVAIALATELETCSPHATETAKAMIHGAVGEDRGACIEMLGSAAASASADRSEGVAAFLEKRQPRFGGQ